MSAPTPGASCARNIKQGFGCNIGASAPGRHAPRPVVERALYCLRFSRVFYRAATGEVDSCGGGALVEEEAEDVGMAVPAAVGTEGESGCLR